MMDTIITIAVIISLSTNITMALMVRNIHSAIGWTAALIGYFACLYEMGVLK